MEQKSVLIIENRPFLRDAYDAIFGGDQFKIKNVDTKEEALQLLKQGEFDIVLLDMLFHDGINSIELMETYRKDPQYKGLQKQPFFLAIIDDEDKMEQMQSLVDAIFIMAKFTPGDILAKIQEHFQNPQKQPAAFA